jgi:CubicO group peptidase (beta-lactamase class C family)
MHLMILRFVFAFWMTLLLVACTKNNKDINNKYQFDVAELEKGIRDTYGPQTAGFSYAIGMGNAVVRYGAMGKARMGDDGEVDYTAETRQHLFSVTKFMTAAAVVAALEKKGLGLEEKVVDYLPSDWTIHSSHANLNFRQLLSHKTGFSIESDFYADLKTMMAQPRGDTTYDYNNSNFTLCRILLPYLRYDRNWLESQDGPLEEITAVLFRQEFRALVLEPAGLQYWAFADFKDWTHVNGEGYRAPRYYVLDNPGAGSTEYGDFLVRAGAGALVLSSYETAQVLLAFQNNQIVSKDNVERMKAWSCGFDGSVTGKRGTYYWKNGGLQDSDGRGGETIIMVFPMKTVVSINCNSNRSKDDQFVGSANRLRDLFDAAWKE